MVKGFGFGGVGGVGSGLWGFRFKGGGFWVERQP